ncbi:condensation domain-containing protein, partial [Actinomadura vinacea]|uniref:condensation domain-containing protein n=1 Tax=Actinomadura vinacea TaxID=115336 RepID=UPI0031CFCF44
GMLDPAKVPGVGAMLVGSERVSAQVAADWGPGRRVRVGYGPTEVTVISSVGVADPASAEAPPIGRPIANTRVYVLDERLQPVPVGVAGELFIAGAGVGRGYGNRAALTGERFVADPFAGDGSRMYRSGDRVRWRASGELDFLGRTDDQVKVRGFRVELGEIESVLASHPGVRAAVVAAVGEGADQRLVAYLVPADQAEGIPDVAGLRARAGERLPSYMLPGAFVELAGLPLTPNGKVDRAALPAPDGARPELGGFVAASGATEEALAGVWAQVLDVERVGAEDNFFELGGNSLLATQVAARIRRVFGAEVPMTALFDEPTVRGLALVIDALGQDDTAPPITPTGRDQDLPLSFAQQRLWFIDQLEPGSTEYNVPSPVRWSGEVNVGVLEAALGALVARHEVLRTRLVADAGGVARQVIDPPSPFPLPVLDVSGAEDPPAAVEALVAADAGAPFDLSAGPLIRGSLVRLGAGDHLLALTMHHVIGDEWSGRVLRRDLTALYDAFRAGLPDPLPPLPVQYADFAVWQRQWLTGDVLDGQLEYWRERLAGVPVLDLPADRSRPPVRLPDGAAIRFRVPEETADRLRAVSRVSDASMYMTLLAAYLVMLARYSG